MNSFTTYRAMLFYLYTGEITFTPLASSLTVAVLEGKADDETSRRDYLLQKTPRSSDEVVKPASPHAVYKLADKLDLEDLKDRAKRRIIGGFKVENVRLACPVSLLSATDVLSFS